MFCVTTQFSRMRNNPAEETDNDQICRVLIHAYLRGILYCSCLGRGLQLWSAGPGIFSVGRKSKYKKARYNSNFCERDSDVSITSVYLKNERADNFGGEWHQPARKKVKSEARCVIRNKHSKKQRRRHSTHCVVLCQRRCGLLLVGRKF